MSDRLAGVHPTVIEKVARVLAVMELLGFPMRVTDGVRTLEQQQRLYAQGRTAPGRIVTYADGVRKRSNHQAHADGFGRAVDCCFVVDGQPSWDPALPWAAYGANAEALGLSWGGNWTRFKDLPHVEWII